MNQYFLVVVVAVVFVAQVVAAVAGAFIVVIFAAIDLNALVIQLEPLQLNRFEPLLQLDPFDLAVKTEQKLLLLPLDGAGGRCSIGKNSASISCLTSAE